MAPISRTRLVAAVGAGCLALALATQLPAHAAPGAGTWTRVTSPPGRTVILSHAGQEGNLTVSGTTSSDVTTVNVVCLRGSGADVGVTTVATSVPVAGGTFQTTVPVPGNSGNPPTCRLRALPQSVNAQTDYLSSYAGPVLDLDRWGYVGPATHETDFFVVAGRGTGEGQFASVNGCSVSEQSTVQPDLSVLGGSHGCLGYVGPNAAGSQMLITVDGHPVYATHDQNAYHLPGAKPVRVSVSAAKQGTITWRQTDALLRCQTDTFPPSGSSCLAASASGVSLRRVGTFGAANGHQVRLDDAFVSTDGKAHRVRVTYQSSYAPPSAGQTGLRIPGQGSAWLTPTAGQHFGGLGQGAATVLIRSNLYADEGDQGASTWALTWSRTVSGLDVDTDDATVFGTPMSLRVPRHGRALLRIVADEAVTTARAARLAALARKAMMTAPVIISPTSGTVIHGRTTTVTGVLVPGVNGLPTAVEVNGHAATVKPNKRGTHAVFSVTFSESLGRHTLTAVATDAGGNRRSSSVVVRNS